MAEESEGVYKCTKCEVENALDAKFCQGCGSKLIWIYPQRTCSHCGYTWRPRKAKPKTCSACGYILAKDDRVKIIVPEILDEGAHGMLETVCFICSKKTTKYARYRLNKGDPAKDVCYTCLADYFDRKSKGEDIVEGSFRTTGLVMLPDGTEVLKRE